MSPMKKPLNKRLRGWFDERNIEVFYLLTIYSIIFPTKITMTYIEIIKIGVTLYLHILMYKEKIVT